jgi:hypothetical protein
MASSRVVFESRELVRESVLATLIKNWEGLDIPSTMRERWANNVWDPRTSLEQYLRSALAASRADTHGQVSEVRVSYTHSALSHKSKVPGRKFAVKGLSMQSFPRQIRHTLAHDLYHDLDIVNAAPTILQQWCAKNNIPIPALDDYIANRETQLRELMDVNAGQISSRDDAKRVVLALMNGGTKDADALTVLPNWLAVLRTQLAVVHANILGRDEFSTLRALVESDRMSKGRGGHNLAGAITNHLLCHEEDRILSAGVEYISATRGISTENCVLVFDGFMIPRSVMASANASANGVVLRDLLSGLASHVRERTGYAVTFVEKAMDERLDLSRLVQVERPPSRTACEDSVAAQMLVDEIVPSRVVFCGRGSAYAYTLARTWSGHEADVKTVLDRCVLGSGIKKIGLNGVVRPYTGDSGQARGVVTAIKAYAPIDTAFPKKLFKGGESKLFFEDGVFDFTLGERGEFREERADGSDMAVFRIPYDFPRVDVNDAEAVEAARRLEKEVYEKYFVVPFGGEDIADNMLQHLARALAGHCKDKQLVVVPGERNSGKSTMATLVEAAFCDYVYTVNANSLLAEPSTENGKDFAKGMSWVMQCAFRRIVFTHEIKVDPDNPRHRIDGNKIKNVMSGGDSLLVRGNHVDERHVTFEARLFMMCNDFPPVEPADALQFCHVIKTPFDFKSAKDIEDRAAAGEAVPRHWRLGDPDIKELAERRETANAFVRLVLSRYRRDMNDGVVACPAVVAYTRTHKRDTGAMDDLESLLERIDVTGDAKDTILSAEAQPLLPSASKQKLSSLFAKAGGNKSENIVREGRRSRGWTGVRLKEADQ